MKKTMLTSLFHAKTLLVLSSALPVSLFNSNVPPGQLRGSLSFRKQPGTVVGLLLYATGIGVVVYRLTVTEVEERMRGGSLVATY